MNVFGSWFLLASAILCASPRLPNADEISVTLRLLSQAGTAKTSYWYGEPIRFDVALTSEANPAIQLQISGTRNPLFPVGDGLVLRRSDGKSMHFGLTPVWHHLPETKELHLSRIGATYTLDFPNYGDVGQHEYKLLSSSPADRIDAIREKTSLIDSPEWVNGFALIPAGMYTVTYVRRAQRIQGKRSETVELRSNTVVLTIRE
jgi:hypothetical protein